MKPYGVLCHLSTVKMLVGVCYRSPNGLDSNNDQLLVLFSKAVQHVNYAKDTRLMILGDFNYPEIDYVHHCVASTDNSAAYKFFKTTHDLFLHQHVSEPTRVTDRHRPSLLDYVFTDESHLIDTIECKPPLGKSDHVCLSWSLRLSAPNPEQFASKLNYWKGDYSQMCTNLQAIDWEENMDTKSVEEMWQFFKSKLRHMYLYLNQEEPSSRVG